MSRRGVLLGWESVRGEIVLGPVETVDKVEIEIAFAAVYEATYDRMVRLARIASAETVPAEEIVQDAFIQLYRRWTSVQDPRAWLRAAVISGCRSWGRRRGLARRHPPPPATPVLVDDDDAIAVREALHVLTPRQRAAVVLRYFEDLPEVEIACLLRCRPGTVKSLLSRSMPKLKEALVHD